MFSTRPPKVFLSAVLKDINCVLPIYLNFTNYLFATFSPVNLGFDLEQIATEMIFAGSNSLNSVS